MKHHTRKRLLTWVLVLSLFGLLAAAIKYSLPLRGVGGMGLIETAEMVLWGGDAINQAGLGGSETLLHEAADENNVVIASLLIMRGANPNARDSSHQTPLHLAADQDYIKIARLLVMRGADLDATDRFSRTPLHLAVMLANRDMIAYILKKGARVDIADYEGNTPLGWAIKLDLPDVAEALRRHGARK